VRSLHQSLILYLLSGQPDPVPVTRANLTLYVVVISAAGLAMLAVSGLLTMATLQQAALLALPFAGGVVAGSGLIARFSDQPFRQLTIVFMFIVTLGGVVRLTLCWAAVPQIQEAGRLTSSPRTGFAKKILNP
jgi:uncharacterized membrane protein YfcA